jgi:hypothetical protein
MNICHSRQLLRNHMTPGISQPGACFPWKKARQLFPFLNLDRKGIPLYLGKGFLARDKFLPGCKRRVLVSKSFCAFSWIMKAAGDTAFCKSEPPRHRGAEISDKGEPYDRFPETENNGQTLGGRMSAKGGLSRVRI